MDEKEKIKRAIIAGAARALYHKKNKKVSSDEDVMKHVVHDLKEIIYSIETN